MDIKTKKQYLQQYNYLKFELKRKTEDIEVWRSEREKMTGYLSDMPKGKGNDIQDKQAEMTAKIIDLEQEIVKDMIKVRQEKIKIENEIKAVRNSLFKQLLTLRYIECKKFEEIALEMHYSYRHIVAVLHPKALKSFKVLKK